MPVEICSGTVEIGGRVLVDRLTHRFPSRTVSALVGPSGAGKSTLLATIGGFRSLQQGVLECTSSDGGPARVSYVSQAATLFMERNALENVALGFVARGLDLCAAYDPTKSVLERLGMSEIALTKAHNLSGGERQRVMIARAIAMESDILLADEPTASLDPLSRERVCQALGDAARTGATVIVATHDPFVARYADEVVSPWSE